MSLVFFFWEHLRCLQNDLLSILSHDKSLVPFQQLVQAVPLFIKRSQPKEKKKEFLTVKQLSFLAE